MWKLNFISEEDFKKHVGETINQYGDKLMNYDLKKLNKNILDPIKLIFDKMVYGCTWEEIIKNETFRQRDKASNNDIGYFHQKIFQYMKDCTVPKEGWDVIFKPKGGIEIADCGKVSTIYVEMKNKHNTMNSASSGKTYIKMQSQILNDDDCVCCLVEAIAKKSQNISWSVTVDGTKHKHKNIRRISMDEFYKIITGQEDAFYQMCLILPDVIKEVIESGEHVHIPNDTAYNELLQLVHNDDKSIAFALYLLSFNSYLGFNNQR